MLFFTKIIIKAIDLYKKAVSPFFINSCRFSPSCSDYARQAIIEYGPLKGIVLAGWRVLRCNPLSKGGYDPVIKREK